MAASTPTDSKTPDAPFLLGGSTKMMLVCFELGRGELNADKVKPNNPYLIQELTTNSKLGIAQQTIQNTQKARDSVFGVKAELEQLVPTMTESPTIKPNDKKELLQRATQLGIVIEDAIKSDTKLAELETQLHELEVERLKQRKSNYTIIQEAADPAAKAKELLEKDRINTEKIANLQKEITSAINLFQHLHKKIGQEYTGLYDAVPGSLKMKRFEEIKKIAEQPSVAEPSPTPRAS
ncbi:MAG: hypothetical protein K0S63_168 [Gammaproteobacteria bacterium]|jgi:hypothetical protein|nr:hypothetical protein [Gammaproteobacteria bacterium]